MIYGSTTSFILHLCKYTPLFRIYLRIYHKKYTEYILKLNVAYGVKEKSEEAFKN
jgi:hypothetical protein